MNPYRSSSWTAALVGAVACLSATTSRAQIQTYDVSLDSNRFSLYTDPYNGNEITMGGFSGLFPVPGKPDRFYVVTDRGPAPDAVFGNTSYKCFAIPEFGPHLLTVRLTSKGTAKIEKATPLKRPGGGWISGLPTTTPATDVPYDLNLNVLPYDEDSLDVEGITIDAWGNFWVCEEYKPSVAMLAPSGHVQLRLVPIGTKTGYEEVPTYEVLPAVLSKRRNNRGFEGIAATADGMIYAIVQRPLNNPNQAAANANGNVRIVGINLHTLLHDGSQPLVTQYIYKVPGSSVTVSDLFAKNNSQLLVSERVTDTVFLADLSQATDITDMETTDGKLKQNAALTIEQLTTAQLGTYGITPVTKTAVYTGMTVIDQRLEKVEGLCVVGNSLVLTYDNDFNVFDTATVVTNPDGSGPLAAISLVGGNVPKLYVIPLP